MADGRLNSFSASELKSSPSEWRARLQLKFRKKSQRTVLQHVRHFGPLRVQRPFYPEGPVCHVYLLHPPGGMVGGDTLDIEVEVESEAQCLLTTPAAGKAYRVAAHAPPQCQNVSVHLADAAVLEWLPQETIIFNGARAKLHNRFYLKGEATLLGWDIICLGRKASGETFDSGSVHQSIEIYRDQKPLLIERVHFDGGSPMLQAPWGMNAASVSGTMFATLRDDINLEQLRALFVDDRRWGLTQKRGVVIVRYLGDSAELCRRGFERVWQGLRPQLMNREALAPRIWNT